MRAENKFFFGMVCLGFLGLGAPVGELNAWQRSGASKGPAASGVVGVWQAQSAKGALDLLLNADGTGELNGDALRWELNQGVLILRDANVTNMVNVRITSNTLTISGGNLSGPIEFRRVGSEGNAGGETAQAPSPGPGVLGVVTEQGNAPGPVGTWRVQNASGSFTLVLNADGSGTFNQDELRWEFNQGVLTLRWTNGNTIMYQASLTPTTLHVSGANLRAPITFERVGSAGAPQGLEAASAPVSKGKSATPTFSGPVGTWETQGPAGPITLELRPDGTGTMAGESIHWKLNQGVLIITRAGGDVHMYNAKITASTITLSSATMKQPSVFRRVDGSAEALGRGAQARAGKPAGLVGTWEVPGPSGIVRLVLDPDGSGTFGGGAIHWAFNQNVLSLTGPNGRTIMYNAALRADSMTLSGGNLEQPLTFRRPGSAPEGGSEGNESPESSSPGGLTGRWQGQSGIIEFNRDGSAIYNGQNFRYTVQGNVLTLIGNDGQIPMTFHVAGDTMTVTIQGQVGTLTRVREGNTRGMRAGGGAGSNPPEMSGQWCYFSATNTGQIVGGHQQCFTLYPNGTYQYFGQFDSVNQYGGAASEGTDTGTWRVGGSTFTANSQRTGVHTYRLEKRNNQNNDPMLCLDGQCFATATQKPPWPQ